MKDKKNAEVILARWLLDQLAEQKLVSSQAANKAEKIVLSMADHECTEQWETVA